MHPHFNPRPYNHENQLNINGPNASASQQGQGNFGPNPMQIRPQFHVGLLNSPQLAMPPFANPNAYYAPTQFFPFLQGSFQPLNANNSPQLFAHNAVCQPPQFLPNGQLNLSNLVQNVNQLLQMQMMNCGPQNLGPLANSRTGLMNGGEVVLDGNGLKHVNHNAAVTQDFGSPQTQRNQVFSPGAAKCQSNARIVQGRKSDGKNFNGNPKHDASQRGFCKKQFHHRQNAQGNFKLNNENGGNGNKNYGLKNFDLSNIGEQTQVGKKRSLVLSYTEQEIQQWREARRKNYPSNANMEKKSKENPSEPEVMDAVAKMRRQQLKEILAKQAELGCEVAEVPSYYLSDSEQQTDGRQQKSKEFDKRGNFHKFDKRKFHQFDRFSKRQRPDNRFSANSQNQSDHCANKQRWSNNGCATNQRTLNKREPSLLKKLLRSDIKRDKRHLLQVFRFMVVNSFFENTPEKSLKLPIVIVKEPGYESEIQEEKPQVVKCDALDKYVASCSRDYAVAEDEGERPQEVGEIMV